jgi:spore maturation protein CgeB
LPRALVDLKSADVKSADATRAPRMKFVIFGLTVSSSWANGHATLWRGLINALTAEGHRVVFFERDVPYYANSRDLWTFSSNAELLLYPDWETARWHALVEIQSADVAIVTSYCPDGIAASELIADSAPGVKVFYDLDTPVTLARLNAGEMPPYLPPHGLGDFDLVLSYTGGAALDALRVRLGAVAVAPLYGHVDPEAHRPAAPEPPFVADLSYLGTFASDRQRALARLFLQPARLRPELRFVIGGAGYPVDFPWSENIYFVRHLPPHLHSAFFASARLTLNVTRADMAAMGYCPSGRLFEAAACGVPILSDYWDGLETFFTPDEEIVIARNTKEAVAALDIPGPLRIEIGAAARARVLEEHTSAHRARRLVELVRGLGVAPVEPAAAAKAPSADPPMSVRD